MVPGPVGHTIGYVLPYLFFYLFHRIAFLRVSLKVKVRTLCCVPWYRSSGGSTTATAVALAAGEGKGPFPLPDEIPDPITRRGHPDYPPHFRPPRATTLRSNEGFRKRSLPADALPEPAARRRDHGGRPVRRLAAGTYYGRLVKEKVLVRAV